MEASTRTFSTLALAAMMLLTSSGSSPAEDPEAPLCTFSLVEAFGVSHPDQIIDLECSVAIDPSSARMIGPDGREVPYQILRNGRVAVRTDLPAGARRTWKLMPGRATAVDGGVTVEKTEAFYAISNGLTGVRLPLHAPDLSQPPAPIQGIRYPDGTWTATGPNVLSVPAEGMDVRVLEQGPLKVVVEVSYQLDRPELRHGDEVVMPAGDGYYKSTIEVQAGQPSILFEEDSDTDLSYSVDASAGLQPNQARYRGHGSRAIEFGRTADGKLYPGGGLMDAFVDLAYDQPKESGRITDETTWKRISAWDPWPKEGGWYWMLYNAAAMDSANVLGIFAGPASRAIGASHSGVGIFTAPRAGGTPAAGLTITLARSGGDARVFPRTRFAWGLFVGTKESALLPADQVQPIGLQWNLHAGISLGKIHRYALDFPDPPQGYGALFMEPDALARIIDRLRTGAPGLSAAEYRHWLSGADSYSRELIAMWADPGDAPIEAAVAEIEKTAQGLLDAMVNDRGIFHSSGDQMRPSYAYWMGALEMLRKGLWIDQVLADERTSPEDRAKVKAIASLFANILWDNDYVPLFEGHGMHLGNPNMPVLQQGVRNFYTLFLAAHPAMEPRVPEVERIALADLHAIVNEYGAEMSAVNYISAGFMPTLNTLLQLRMVGRDHFGAEPRLSNFAEFYMNLMTPPEVRFGGTRKVISIGDGSTQSPAVVGPLATGFRDADPALSARLMGAWQAAGKPHSSFFGTTVLQIDEDAPASDPMLGDATFPGWMSVLRHGWGTPNETALWMVNGDFYHDHRHVDHGSIVLYALGAPLSLDWGSLYLPQVVGAFQHNTVVPEANIAASLGGLPPETRHGWDQDSPPLETANFVWGLGPWVDSTQEAFVSFTSAAHARARFRSPEGRSPNLTWTRSITSIHPDEAHPIIVLRDTFEGPDAAASKVFSMNLMAQGEVDTPAGKMLPPLRTFDAQGGRAPDKKELPSAGTVFPVAPGLNRLSFTGQWLIDWDLHILAGEPQQAHIGNWGHYWHPGPEQAQFEAAQGRPFEERQHILRIKGNGTFQVLILPYRKGESRDAVRVSHDGSDVRIRAEMGETVIGDHHYSFSHDGREGLASFDARRCAAHGIVVDGGPTEVMLQANQATITVHGDAGARRVLIPGEWDVREARGLRGEPVSEAGIWILEYEGGPPARIVFDRQALPGAP